MEKIYLGLDISTSVIGVCINNTNTKDLFLQAIDLRKIKNYFTKADKVREFFIEINKIYSINNIGIEENLQAFRPGLSSAKTLMQLSRFNGVVSQIAYEVFGVEPLYINVNSARKDLQVKVNKKLEKSTKDQVFEWVKKDLENNNIDFEWPTKTLKSGPNKGRVKFDNTCYDISDSYVICKALILNENKIN